MKERPYARLSLATAEAAAHFEPDRALATAADLWRIARAMDSGAVRATAERVLAMLREAGLEDAALEEIPADGASSANGWLLPVAWSVREAVLVACLPGGERETLADVASDPQAIALYSPPTPGGGWVSGPVAGPDRADPAGAFVFAPDGIASPDLNTSATAAGALALIGGTSGVSQACRYINYGVPMDAGRACIPCFSLSPAATARLSHLLALHPDLRLAACVVATRGAGTAPLVTASIGQGEPAAYVCAHLDEIGAQDNASGVAVALEALRVLKLLAAERRFAPSRCIRAFFSLEVRGMQAWLCGQKRPPSFLAGLNLDMVGCAPTSTSVMQVRRGFPGQAHFAGHLLEAAAGLADAVAGPMPRTGGLCGVSDALIALHPEPGHVSLEQTPGPTYHTSADVPATLSRQAIHWSGATATAFLHSLATFGVDQALDLGRTIVRRASSAMARNPSGAAARRRVAAAELNALRRAIAPPRLFGPWRTAEDLYGAGVRRATGRWPAVEKAARLEAIIAALPAAPPAPPAARKDGDGREEASTLVPQSLVRGFLSFEDHLLPAQRGALSEAVGLAPGWSTETWAWLLLTRFRGKATLLEMVEELAGMGVAIDLQRAIRLTHYLASIGKVRLRPLLTRESLSRAVRSLGVRSGSILCVQASLSQFGYVCGGADALIDALLDVIGPDGTLCIPTHSLSVLGADPYDPARSPSQVGAVSECFRRRPGVRRSLHPTHSVAALGPAAAGLLSMPRIDLAPLARDGFWGRICEAGGDMLLLCPIRSATILHAGEAWTGVPQPPLVAHGRDARGRRRVVVVPQAPWHVDHFEAAMAAPLMSAGVLAAHPIGDGIAYFAPVDAMAQMSVAVNAADPRVSLGRNGECRCFHCQAVREGLASAAPSGSHAAAAVPAAAC